jgi:hypothetical protein
MVSSGANEARSAFVRTANARACEGGGVGGVIVGVRGIGGTCCEVG